MQFQRVKLANYILGIHGKVLYTKTEQGTETINNPNIQLFTTVITIFVFKHPVDPGSVFFLLDE